MGKSEMDKFKIFEKGRNQRRDVNSDIIKFFRSNRCAGATTFQNYVLTKFDFFIHVSVSII